METNMRNRKIALVFTVLLPVLTVTCAQKKQEGQSLDLQGWSVWGGLKASAQGNSVILNGSVTTAGYVNEHLNTNMRNKTVILEIQNIKKSVFSDNRMLKITANKAENEMVITPENVSGLIHNEYVSSSYARIEFIVPDDFDGKLGFVFYQANLKDLKITTTYK
jgi:hypothetical protein